VVHDGDVVQGALYRAAFGDIAQDGLGAPINQVPGFGRRPNQGSHRDTAGEQPAQQGAAQESRCPRDQDFAMGENFSL
jgi:hypothetical protein